MIELKNAYGGYGKNEVIKDVSLKFNEGEITVIVGPNGCGKSTLLYMCCGQLALLKGQALIDGYNIHDLSRKEIAQKVSLLPQNRATPDITVGALATHGRFPWLDYPRIYKAKDKEIAASAMIQVGIEDKKNELLSHLSGGERQRAYLAMILAQNTSNILFDEPTTFLDISHQLELFSLIKKLKSDSKCVVAVLHDLTMALDIADRIVVMKGGSIINEGTPQDIFHSGCLEQTFNVKITRDEHYKFSRM